MTMDDSTETLPRDWSERKGDHHGSLTTHIYLEHPHGALRIPRRAVDLAGLTGNHRSTLMRARMLHRLDGDTDGHTYKSLHSLGVEPTRRHPAHQPGRIAPHRLDRTQSRPQRRPHTEGMGAAVPTFMEPRPLQYHIRGEREPFNRKTSTGVQRDSPGRIEPAQQRGGSATMASHAQQDGA